MQLIQNVTNEEILNSAKSVCPVCLETVDAQVISENQAVYLTKSCPDHGSFSAYLWPDKDHYQWMTQFSFPVIRPKQPVPSRKGCLKDCGLCSSHLRHPTLVEIELTEHCNLRCPVCFMAANAERLGQNEEPSLALLEATYKEILARTGPQTSIQLTGGEPTVRADLPDIIRLGRLTGFEAIEVNTNGVVLAHNSLYAKQLADAGVSGIYLQFDGLTRHVYERIRGADLLDTKLRAIAHCRAAGVQVVLAMTVIAGVNEHEMGDVLEFALANRDVIAGIAYQPAFGSGRFEISPNRRLTMGDVIFLLAEQSKGLIEPFDFWPLGCSHPLCDAATYLINDQGTSKPLTRLITPEEYARQFDPDSPQGSVFADIAAKLFPQLEPGLSIVIMNFMDAMTMDLNRIRECSMIVSGPTGNLVPFCAYQLTNVCGDKKNNMHLRGWP